MSIRQKGERWYGEVMVEGRRHSKAFGTNRRTAQRAYNTWLQELKSGSTPLPKSALKAMREAYVADLGVRTGESHRSEVERILKEHLPTRLDRVTLAWAMGMQQSLRGSGKAVATVNRYVGYVRGFATWLVRKGILAHDPLQPLRRLPQSEGTQVRPHRAPTDGELRALLKAAKGLDQANAENKARANKWYRIPQSPMFALVAGTGLRWGEAVKLTWRDIASDGIRVPAGISKNSRSRYVPVQKGLMAELAAHRSRVGFTLKGVPSGEDRVLLTPTGKPWHSQNYGVARRLMEKVCERGEVDPPLTWHDLRHAYVTRLREAGVDVALAAELAGHSVEMAQRIYSHQGRLEGAKQEAVAKLADLTMPAKKKQRKKRG